MVSPIAQINRNRQLAQGVTWAPPVNARQLAPVIPLPRRQPTAGGDLADRLGAAASDILTNPAFDSQPASGGGGLKDSAVHGLGWVIGNPVSKAVLKPLSVLDYPRAAMVGGVRQLLETGALEQANKALATLPGIGYSPIRRPEDDTAGFDWDELWRDIKKHEGFGTSIVEPQFGAEGADWNRGTRIALGFGGDVGADPFSYLSGGTHAASGVEARAGYLNKLLDAQKAAGLEQRTAAEAAETAAEWARLGGTGAEEAATATSTAAEQAQRQLDELTKIGDRNAVDVIGRRGVNRATPEQLRAMGIDQHAIRFGGVAIPGGASEATSRAMSRFLSPGKELWSQTAGKAARKVWTPRGVLKQTLGPATERLLTGEGAMTPEVALRAYRVNETMRLALGDFRAPSVQFLHQLGNSLKGLSKDERAELVRVAEEQGVENAATKMAPQMIETIKSVYKKYTPEGQPVPEPPELKPWLLPNGQMSKYVMPHVLSRDSFRFFNRLRKGDNPLLDFIRRDLGVTDKDLLEEGGFLQRRLFRPNPDGSPQAFKIGKEEITIETGSLAELEDKLGGLLRKHGFEGKLYETDPAEAWRRYIQSTEKDVARNVALQEGATQFGLSGLRRKPGAPTSWDPYGRDITMQPAVGETEPRYIRGRSPITGQPVSDDVYQMVEDEAATKARNEIITAGGDRNVHAQVLSEYRDIAPAQRENLATQIENTRQYTEAAYEKARQQSGRKLAKAEGIVTKTRATVDRLETEYKELLKESSANEQLIAAAESTIHGVRSQTPKRIKAAIQTRLDEIAEQLAHERGRLESLQKGLGNALQQSEQKQVDDALDRIYNLEDAVQRAERNMTSTRGRAQKAVENRISRGSQGREHLISAVENRQAAEIVGAADSPAAARAQELLQRREQLTTVRDAHVSDARQLTEQANRIDEQLSRTGFGSAPRTGERQARLEAARAEMADQVRSLRRQAAVHDRGATTAERGLRDVERRIKDDDWLKAQRITEQYREQQSMIENYSNPKTGVDMPAAKGRLNAARTEQHRFLNEERIAGQATELTPLQRSEERLTKAVGEKPKVDYFHHEPDDMPGGRQGTHVLTVSTPTPHPPTPRPPTNLPSWIPSRRLPVEQEPTFVSSLLWSAETGEVLMISVDPNFQRRGVGTAMYDYATEYAKEQGLVPPRHSGIQTTKGQRWAPEADERIAWWTRNPENTKGLQTWEAEKSRRLLDSPEAREYAADESIATGLRHDIDRIENPTEANNPVEWTEVGRRPAAKEPREMRTWRQHNGKRRRLQGEMERIRNEESLTPPPTREAFQTESYRRPKPRRGGEVPKWMEEYREKPSTRRVRGKEPWWTEEYPTRPDLSSTKRSRNARLKKLQAELDIEDEWLAKHPQPPHPRPNPHATRFRAKINGKLVRLERNTDIGALGGAQWKIILPDGTERAFSGDLAQAFREAEQGGRALGRTAPDEALLSDLRQRLAGAEARMRLQDQGPLQLPGRQEWEQPYSQSWWRDTKDVFEEELGSVIDETSPLWNDVENMHTLDNSEVTGLIQDEWRRLTPEGQARMQELGWDRGTPPAPAEAGAPISQQVAQARRTLAGAAREQSLIPPKPIPPPTPEELVRRRFEPNIAEAEQRVRQMGTRGTPAELESVRAPIQEAANQRIAGLQGNVENLRFQQQRISEMVTNLYQNRMPDPVNDWRQALDNAEQARAIHQEISDYIEHYSVRQRAIDIVEKNRRAGAPTKADLERVAAREMRPEDAQGLMAAVDDINRFMTNAEQILPVGVRKRIEAALMSHEQALAALTKDNDLPARELEKIIRDANNGKLPKVLKAQLRDAWREVGADGGIIIDKELERAFFGFDEVLDSKLFGRLFTTWTNFFKTYATLTPGFHVRNAISAIFMNATEGVGVREQLRALRLWGEYRRAENPIEWLAGRSEAERRAFQATFASGAGGQFIEAGVGEARFGAGRAAERLFANPATRGSKRLGEWVEGPQRLALGLHSTQAGGTAAEALARITRIHFDYGQVSKFDEQMKRIIPFWTFMSRNVPLQFTQMWMKPKMYLRYQSLARNIKLGAGEEPIIPDYITQGGGIYTGVKTPEWASKIPVIGPPAGMPVVLQPDLPQNRYFDDLQRVTNALSGQGVGQMATNLNPMLTVPAEFATRTDFFTGQHYDPSAMVKVGGAALPYAVALSLVGQARRGADGEWYVDAAALNAVRGLDPNLDRMMRLMPQLGGLEGTDRTGASTTSRQAESLARWAGLPVRTISKQQQQSAVRSRVFNERDRQRRLAASGG